ncbi:hypothetical protein GCM10010994_44760 [Chelatococcus reniformis]|uniref:Uncharacterized protein n=2 Tax=Chelatococcus reniformis TaxID=1494448 RepID=A0A916UQJ3_9HYPH|nr:hypothetical protein GCM10010994_44760 [Chelatococcus reniformis]
MMWMTNFFGTHADAPQRFEPLRTQLERAISDADVVGTFREKVSDIEKARETALTLGAIQNLTNDQKLELNQIEWRLLDHLIKPHLRRQSLLTTTNIHIKMEESGLLKTLAAEAGQLNLITGNDVREKLEAAFPGTRITQHRVPTEYKFETSRAGWSESMPHFPDVFDQLMVQIKAGNFEGVTFIGAGPCGKIYASAIKDAGGIAIDIGSIMDVWAGRNTRSFMLTMRQRTLMPGTRPDA